MQRKSQLVEYPVLVLNQERTDLYLRWIGHHERSRIMDNYDFPLVALDATSRDTLYSLASFEIVQISLAENFGPKIWSQFRDQSFGQSNPVIDSYFSVLWLAEGVNGNDPVWSPFGSEPQEYHFLIRPFFTNNTLVVPELYHNLMAISSHRRQAKYGRCRWEIPPH